MAGKSSSVRNTSEMSTSVMLLLPDNIAPSAPVLAQLLPRPEGIRIGWALSGESDVDVHFLQRKFMDATQWDNILRIDRPSDFPPLPITPAEVNASNYIDTDSLQMRKYTYRIITYDLSGNFSTSKVYEVKPYDDGLRGHIRPFKAKLKNQGQYYIANPTSPGPGGSQADITNTNLGVHNLQWVKGSVMSDGKVAELTWEYDTKHPSSLLDFSIYQKVQNAQLNPTIAVRNSEQDLLVCTIGTRANLTENTNTLIL